MKKTNVNRKFIKGKKKTLKKQRYDLDGGGLYSIEFDLPDNFENENKETCDYIINKIDKFKLYSYYANTGENKINLLENFKTLQNYFKSKPDNELNIELTVSKKDDESNNTYVTENLINYKETGNNKVSDSDNKCNIFFIKSSIENKLDNNNKSIEIDYTFKKNKNKNEAEKVVLEIKVIVEKKTASENKKKEENGNMVEEETGNTKGNPNSEDEEGEEDDEEEEEDNENDNDNNNDNNNDSDSNSDDDNENSNEEITFCKSYETVFISKDNKIEEIKTIKMLYDVVKKISGEQKQEQEQESFNDYIAYGSFDFKDFKDCFQLEKVSMNRFNDDDTDEKNNIYKIEDNDLNQTTNNSKTDDTNFANLYQSEDNNDKTTRSGVVKMIIDYLSDEKNIGKYFKKLTISNNDSVFEKFQADLEPKIKDLDQLARGGNNSSSPTPSTATPNNPTNGNGQKSLEMTQALDENKINQESEPYINFIFNIWINLYRYYKQVENGKLLNNINFMPYFENSMNINSGNMDSRNMNSGIMNNQYRQQQIGSMSGFNFNEKFSKRPNYSFFKDTEGIMENNKVQQDKSDKKECIFQLDYEKFNTLIKECYELDDFKKLFQNVDILEEYLILKLDEFKQKFTPEIDFINQIKPSDIYKVDIKMFDCEIERQLVIIILTSNAYNFGNTCRDLWLNHLIKTIREKNDTDELEKKPKMYQQKIQIELTTKKTYYRKVFASMLDCICDNIQDKYNISASTNAKNNNKKDPITIYLESILNINIVINDIKTNLENEIDKPTTSVDQTDPKNQLLQLDEQFSHKDNNGSKSLSSNNNSNGNNDFKSKIKDLFFKKIKEIIDEELKIIYDYAINTEKSYAMERERIKKMEKDLETIREKKEQEEEKAKREREEAEKKAKKEAEAKKKAEQLEAENEKTQKELTEKQNLLKEAKSEENQKEAAEITIPDSEGSVDGIGDSKGVESKAADGNKKKSDEENAKKEEKERLLNQYLEQKKKEIEEKKQKNDEEREKIKGEINGLEDKIKDLKDIIKELECSIIYSKIIKEKIKEKEEEISRKKEELEKAKKQKQKEDDEKLERDGKVALAEFGKVVKNIESLKHLESGLTVKGLNTSKTSGGDDGDDGGDDKGGNLLKGGGYYKQIGGDVDGGNVGNNGNGNSSSGSGDSGSSDSGSGGSGGSNVEQLQQELNKLEEELKEYKAIDDAFKKDVKQGNELYNKNSTLEKDENCSGGFPDSGDNANASAIANTSSSSSDSDNSTPTASGSDGVGSIESQLSSKQSELKKLEDQLSNLNKKNDELNVPDFDREKEKTKYLEEQERKLKEEQNKKIADEEAAKKAKEEEDEKKKKEDENKLADMKKEIKAKLEISIETEITYLLQKENTLNFDYVISGECFYNKIIDYLNNYFNIKNEERERLEELKRQSKESGNNEAENNDNQNKGKNEADEEKNKPKLNTKDKKKGKKCGRFEGLKCLFRADHKHEDSCSKCEQDIKPAGSQMGGGYYEEDKYYQEGGSLTDNEVMEELNKLTNQVPSDKKDKKKVKRMMVIKKMYESEMKKYSRRNIPDFEKEMYESNERLSIKIYFYKDRDQLTKEFNKFLLKGILLPTRTYYFHQRILKLKSKVDKMIKDYETKYKISVLSNDSKNDKLIQFITKFDKLEKEDKVLKKKLATEELTNSYRNNLLNQYRDNRVKLLEYKKASIENVEGVKDYFLDEMRINRYQKVLDKLNDNFLLIKKEAKKYQINLDNKKRKFYQVNTLFLQELNYIKNELDLAEHYSIGISLNKKKLFIDRLYNSYIFYLILKIKLGKIQEKIRKKKNIANEEFKDLIIENELLKKDLKRTLLRDQKEEILEKIKDVNKVLFFFRLNFYNMKISIDFISDLLIKVEFFLSIIDYHLILVNNKYLMYQISNKFMNSKGYIQAMKPEVLIRDFSNLKYSDKLLKSGVLLIHKYMENLYKTKVRLHIKKNTHHTNLNKMVSSGLSMANEINYTGLINSKVKKLLKDAENMKELQKLEKERFNLQSIIGDIIQLNRQIVLLKNPTDIFIYLNIFEFKKKDVKGKKKNLLLFTDKYKYLDNNLKKKVIEIGELYTKIEKFNTHSSLKHFIEPLTIKKDKKNEESE